MSQSFRVCRASEHLNSTPGQSLLDFRWLVFNLQWERFELQRRQHFPKILILKNFTDRHAQLHAWYSNLPVNSARGAAAVCFWAALWNIPDPLSQKIHPACMIWPMSNLHSSLFLLLPFFVCVFFFLLSRTNISVQVFWTLPYPSPHKFHRLGCECSVTHWLPLSHARSDWSSPCSSHMAAKYSSLRPFLLSPTVPFCCAQPWEWVPGFVSCL